MSHNEPKPEFAEIGHCGGQVTFSVKTAHDGHRVYQISFQRCRPGPLKLFAIYALPQGIAVDDIVLGGIGQSWNVPPVQGCFTVYIASDSEGRFGKQCPDCGGYWRCEGGPICPYCGRQGKKYEFLTQAQKTYVSQYCELLGEALWRKEDGDHVIDMDAVADAVGKDSEKPPFYYAEQSQQNKFSCNACEGFNDILGRFGHCSR